MSANFQAVVSANWNQYIQQNSPAPLADVLVSSYKLGRKLGNGQFGEVYAAVCRQSKRQVALKTVVRKNDTTPLSLNQLVDKMHHEAAILMCLRHPAILSFVRLHIGKASFVLVTERMESDLQNCMNDMSLNAIKVVLVQVAHALNYLHERNIAHADVKPGNVLLNDGTTQLPIAKLADFGLAKFVKGKGIQIGGTPSYTAPEVKSGCFTTTKADMWSFGVMAYRMISGNMPFDSKQVVTMQDILTLFGSDFWRIIGAGVQHFLHQLLIIYSPRRYSAIQCLQDPWLIKDKYLQRQLRALERKIDQPNAFIYPPLPAFTNAVNMKPVLCI